MAPRAPRSKSSPAPTNQLLSALEFCSCVSEKLGAPFETHVGLRGNWAIAFNGVVAAGAPIAEDIVAYPHTLLLVEALSRCDENFSLTQLDNGRLSIKSGKFKAVVPCLDPDLMQTAVPDPMIVGITNKFKEAVEAVGVLASENAQHVLTASVLMNGQSVVSTNRVMILEMWHGLDLPPNIPLPKQFVAALVKQKKNLTGFGFSSCSATFYFEDGCWLRTQLYSDEWPDVSSILERQANLWSIDPNFFKSLEAVMPFSEDGNIYSDTNLLKSHADEGVGATFECAGIPKGFVYPAKQLMLMKPYVQKIDYMADGGAKASYCLVFQGECLRGVISGRQRQ
jgi:hypothetical protein